MIETFPQVYHRLLLEHIKTLHGASDFGRKVTNERTGEVVATAWGARAFVLDLSDGRVPVVGTRRLRPSKAAAEVAWFLSGESDATWINNNARHWRDFCETEESGVKWVDGSYGSRLRHRPNDLRTSGFGRDQWSMACHQLREHPTDRRCFVSFWDPRRDGLGDPSSPHKNVPCPLGFHARVVAQRLHWSVFMRSSDTFMGLPYDVMGMAIMQSVMAADVGVGLGTLSFCLADSHLYEVHAPEALRCLELMRADREVQSFVPLVYVTTKGILRDRDSFVDHYADLYRATAWPDFDPQPEIVL